jgi:membrane protease YdiL (CAAX protease family)
MLPLMLRGLGDWGRVIPGFFNLTLAGILLGLGYQRSGNLYFSFGLHAGWIFWLKSYGLLTAPVTAAHLAFWGTQKLIDGWLALAVLACALATLCCWPFARTPEKPA